MIESADGRTHARIGRTDGRRLESNTISYPRAFGSDELKIRPEDRRLASRGLPSDDK